MNAYILMHALYIKMCTGVRKYTDIHIIKYIYTYVQLHAVSLTVLPKGVFPNEITSQKLRHAQHLQTNGAKQSQPSAKCNMPPKQRHHATPSKTRSSPEPHHWGLLVSWLITCAVGREPQENSAGIGSRARNPHPSSGKEREREGARPARGEISKPRQTSSP